MQDIFIRLEKLMREQAHIENRRTEICCEIDQLEREDANLADRFSQLDFQIDACQRALAGEPIAIWVELERF